MDLVTVLRSAAKFGASDIRLVVGMPPVVRVDGEMVPMRAPALDSAGVQGLAYSMLAERWCGCRS